MRDLKTDIDLPDDLIIDLRDPLVADGLADMLSQVSQLSERTGAAEARVEMALHERMAATGRLRLLTSDLEHEQAERHRLAVDNAALARENEVRHEQLAQLESELEHAHYELATARDAMKELAVATDDLIEWLQTELARTKRANHTLEALIGRRGRRNYERLIDSGSGEAG